MSIKKLFCIAAFLISSLGMSALEITRYVSAIGTGDGMTAETPTSDLAGMLALGEKVDNLILYVSPGFYTIHSRDFSCHNIMLDGSWKDEGTSDMVRINCPGISFTNSYLYKVSFSGNVGIDHGNLTRCDADGTISMSLNNGDCALRYCKAKGFGAHNWAHRSGSIVELSNCTTTGGNCYGFEAKNIGELYVYSTTFNSQKAGGVNIDGCKYAMFSKCEFSFNAGDGALRLIEFDNSGKVEFSNCEFLYNEVTHAHQHNVNIHSNASFYNCLFIGNTEKDYDSRGFINLARPDFLFRNCTFIDNHGAIELQSYYPSDYQIINCAFWNNGKNNVYAGGQEDVPLLNCAMDYGTGVPELDAQKGIILLTKENKGFNYTGSEIKIEPGSALINRGYPVSITVPDIYSHTSNAFGGTDIGCTEFISAPGLWQPDSLSVTTEYGDYTLCKAEFGGGSYYALLPDNKVSKGNLEISCYDTNFIYLDKMPVTPKVHNNKFIEIHLNNVVKGGYTACIMNYYPQAGWRFDKTYDYATFKDRPIVKIDGDNIQFIKPQPKNAGTTTRKNIPAKKGTTTKKSGTRTTTRRK